MNEEQYAKELKIVRKQKDEFFKTNFQSPIAEEDKKNFKSLEYYEPSLKYRLQLTLQEYVEKQHVKIEDTGGQLRDFLKWGKFAFNLNGEACVLQAYKSDSSEKRLFIPFKDATSGKETYGAGRYLDLYEERDRISEDRWILDFNLASNPWCAYSPNYVCPLIPFENILKVKIEVGEKNYQK